MIFCNQTNNCVRIPELDSSHREADQKMPMHVVYAGQDSSNKVCVIVDDVSHLVKSCLYFRQGKTKDKDGITYHDIHAIANHLGEEICSVLPAFNTLTGSDFTNLFFNRSKIQACKTTLRISNSHKLLLSLPSGEPNISEVTDFVLHVVYNRPLIKKKPSASRVITCLRRKKSKQRAGRKSITLA